jgi:hypothetical protein
MIHVGHVYCEHCSRSWKFRAFTLKGLVKKLEAFERKHLLTVHA